MKYNFKKIASILAGSVMMSSTLAFAAAANYPAPFIQNGSADVAVVYGSMPGAEFDYLAVADITTSLQAKLGAQTASGGSSSSGTTVSGGDFIKLDRSNDKFNIGESANSFYSSLDDDELSMVLADGIYQNDDNNEFDFTQQIELNSSLSLEYFQDNEFNDDKPVVGFNLADGEHVLTYTLDFTPDAAEGGANFADLETTDLTLLGRSYYVVQAQNVSTSPKLTLLDSANSAIITEGATASSITVGSKTYSVAINFIDADEIILTVDGVQTNKLQEGDVFKVATDTYVAVKNILYDSKDNGISKAEISIGSGKIVLQNATEVKINNEDVSEIAKYNDAVLTAYITNSGEDIDKIVLSWSVGEDTFIAANSSDLVLPGFETIKISMGAFNTPNKELTTIENDGDDSIKLTTFVEDGKVSFNLLQANATGFINLGKDSDELLVTTRNSVLNFDRDTDSWFVASWISGDDAESYVFDVTSIDDIDGVQIDSVASGSNVGDTIKPGQYEDFGRIRLTMTTVNETNKNVTITASSVGAGTVSFDRLYTKEGFRILLPVNNGTAAGSGLINLSAGPATHIINFTEEDESGNIASGGNFSATLGLNAGETTVSSVSVTDIESDDGSDDYVGYVISPMATKTIFKTGADQDTLDIEYHGEESFADVYVSEAGAVISSTGVVTTTGGVKELGTVSVTDANVPTGKNLIVVGGSCVNRLAAELIGGAGCGASWEASTGAGNGAFLIQSFDRSGKIATLVAGYNAEDTRNAAKVFTSDSSIDLSAGKKYKSTSATSVAIVSGTTA